MITNKQKKSTYIPKYLEFLSMFYLTVFLTTFIFVHKIVTIFSITTSIATLLVPLLFLSTDIIAEVYGYKYARRTIWIAIICRILFAVLAYGLCAYPTTIFPIYQKAYALIFHSAFRVLIGCTGGYIFGIFVNIYLISKLKTLLRGKHFWIRSIGSSTIGELVFVVTGVSVVFVGTMPFKNVAEIMFMSYCFKLILSIIGVIPASMIVTYLKEREPSFDNKKIVNFNPFKLDIN